MNVKEYLKRALFANDLTCPCCNKEIFKKEYFCDECLNNLPRITEKKCNHCGRAAPYFTEYCDSCKERNTNFDKAYSAYEYLPPISKLIKDLKYENKRYLAEIFAKDLSKIYLREFIAADVLVPVPMTIEREKARGYNQSLLIAEYISKLIYVPVSNVAIKLKETERQATLTAKERAANLKGSFKAFKKDFCDKSVVIVDDVLTTGATADEFARILKRAGAREVYVLTIASVALDNERKQPILRDI